MLNEGVADALLLWLIGRSDFPARPGPLVYLSVHGEAMPTAANQLNGWQNGDRRQIGGQAWGSPSPTQDGRGRRIVNIAGIPFGSHLQERTIVSWALWNAPAGGSILVAGQLAPALTLPGGFGLGFPAGSIEINLPLVVPATP